MNKKARMSKPDHTNTFVPIVNPVGRVDVLAERVAALLVKRFIETHPLDAKLKQTGVDVGAIVLGEVKRTLKRERITDLKSLRRALRK